MPRLCVAAVLTWLGARSEQLYPKDNFDIQRYDALVITGGHDIDPVLYAAEPEVKPNYDAERDKFESFAINEALKHNVPLLGICRGAQLLNACKGGNLYQELKSQRQITSNRRTIFPLKTLCVRSETKLAHFLATPKCKINSLHNQAINKPGEGLEVSARDLDGIVQAIEAPDLNFVLGVQWHPEFLIYMPRQRQIFAALVEAAKKQIIQSS